MIRNPKYQWSQDNPRDQLRATFEAIEDETLQMQEAITNEKLTSLISQAKLLAAGLEPGKWETEETARNDATITKTVGYLRDGKKEETWIIDLPDGWRFEKDTHSMVCFSLKEAGHERNTAPIEPCTDDCSCKEDD